MALIRKQTHANLFYPSDTNTLQTLFQPLREKHPKVQGINTVIVPHAGYKYSLDTALFAYSWIDPAQYDTIFLLGPNHRSGENLVFVLNCDFYETPFGHLEINKEITSKLLKNTKLFTEIDKTSEEREHSLEVQMPVLKYIFKEKKVSIVPVLFGFVESSKIQSVSEVLGKYLGSNKKTLFVISSDFCHWGSLYNYLRFRPKEYNLQSPTIEAYVRALDNEALDLIKKADFQGFEQYLEEKENTICGYVGIMVLLKILKRRGHFECELLNYSRSNVLKSKRDFSVGYAAFVFKDGKVE